MKAWRWLFGHDEYLDGEHIAHEPSLLERLRRSRVDHISLILEIELPW